jgi:nicotinamide-nucleotide amidase
VNDDQVAAYVERIADASHRRGWGVATAESLTTGQIAVRLGAGPQASSWLRGGVVAYSAEVKFDVLGVDRGPVVTEACARQMAEGVAALLGAQAAVAVTGVGGPEPEEGKPPGTVFLAVTVAGRTMCDRLDLDGSPEYVITETANHALARLAREMEKHGDGKESQ